MFEKQNKFYADWRDRKGSRHRKSFTTAEEAIEHEDAQKAAARKKAKRGARSPQPPSSPNSMVGTLRPKKQEASGPAATAP